MLHKIHISYNLLQNLPEEWKTDMKCKVPDVPCWNIVIKTSELLFLMIRDISCYFGEWKAFIWINTLRNYVSFMNELSRITSQVCKDVGHDI